jgi:hypothetical protein
MFRAEAGEMDEAIKLRRNHLRVKFLELVHPSLDQ